MNTKLYRISLFIGLLLGSLLIIRFADAANVAAMPECDVSGAIIENTTWSPTCTAYNVVGNVIVTNGVTLTIEPGALIRFATGTGLNVRGSLVAMGTAASPITFTSASGSPAAGDWNGIYFEEDSNGAVVDASYNYVSGSIVRYSTIQYATKGIRRDYAAPFIANNTIVNNDQGIYSYSDPAVSYPLLVIRDNTITNNGDSTVTRGGGIYVESGRVTILHNLIAHNTSTYSGGGIYFWNTIGSSSQSYLVSENTIIYNITATSIAGNHGGGGIHAHNSNITLTNNVIAYNNAVLSGSKGGGVALYGSTRLIQGNLITNNQAGYGGGIYYSNAAMKGITRDNVITHNAAVYEGGGVEMESYNGSSPFTFSYNSLHNNTANGTANDLSIVVNSDNYEDVDARENWWGSTNLTTIESHILHAVDDPDRALILFQPFLTEAPNSAGAIPTSGGTFTSADGIVQLQVPANAVSEPVTIYYSRLFTPTTSLPSSSLFALGFNLHAIKADGTTVTQFAHPLTLIISYPSDAILAGMGINENDLSLSYWDGGQWQTAFPCSGCTINTVQNKITVILDHFTEFALIAAEDQIFLPSLLRS